MTLDTADTFQPRDSSNSTLVSMNSPIPEPITRDWLSFAISVIFTRHLRSPKDHKPSKPGSVISFKALHPSPNSFFLLPLLLFFFFLQRYNPTIHIFHGNRAHPGYVTRTISNKKESEVARRAMRLALL